MTKMTSIVAAAAIAAGAWSTSAQAVPTEAASVNACENAVRVEAAKFLKKKVAAVDACLQAISTQLVKRGAADESDAARRCVAQFRKLNDTRNLGESIPEKLQSEIATKCAGVTTLDDILGGAGATLSTPLDAQNIGAWCAHFGGSGTLSSLNDWISCVQGAQDCAADTAISTQYPQALQWLTGVRPAMSALSPPSNDPTKISDALAGLDAEVAALAGPGGGTTPGVQCGRLRLLSAGETIGPAAAVGAGAPLRYLDNGDGTITDLNTGLIWEKKIQLDGTGNVANLDDADNCYPYLGTCQTGGALCFVDADCGSNGPCDAGDCQTSSPNGLTVFKWIAALNAANFAGHNDWRLPNIRELDSIVDFGRQSPPSVAPAFQGASCGATCADITSAACSCTQSNGYWSSSVHGTQLVALTAWNVSFTTGAATLSFAALSNYYVRAVRGGL